MPRNKIKEDFNFTTLKGSKIIKLTTCDRFYNKKKLPPFDQCQITFLQVFIAVVVTYIYLIHLKYCQNTDPYL